MIIGISGKKGAGKTSVAMGVMERWSGEARLIPFAGPLKRLVLQLFPLTPSMVAGDETQKNAMTPIGCSGRQIMQEVGSRMRGIWRDCWVHAWRAEVDLAIDESDGYVNLILVPDVRYLNEIAAIHHLGGKVIRLNRAPFADEHESETALDDVGGFDAVLHNENQSLDETIQAASQLVDEWHGGGQWCHCGGDIDDCGHNFPADQDACTHCDPDREPDEMDEEGCLFPGQCCMPGPHQKHECHTPDMLQYDPADVCCACGNPLGFVRLTNKDRVHQWHPECDFMVCKATHTANSALCINSGRGRSDG